MAKNLDLQKHNLIPPHQKLDSKEAKKLLETYNISPSQLPKISSTDPIAKAIGAVAGDIIKIKRESPLGEYNYYRIVIDHV